MNKIREAVKTPAGCWKSCALAVVAGVLALACLLWGLDRVMRPPSVQVTQVEKVSQLTGLTLPPRSVLLEGACWKNYFLVARLRFPRADLPHFLAQGGVPGANGREPLGKCLTTAPQESADIFHDGCIIENGEEGMLDQWRIKSIRRFLAGNCGEYPYPYPPAPARIGALSLSLDLDDPRAVLLFVKWDARGGFAC